MTAKVLEFKKKGGAKPPLAKPDPNAPTPKRLITNNEIFADCYEDVIGKWQAAAAKNTLNEFIQVRLPKYARSTDPGADYVNDLNVIAGVERRIDLKVAVFYPGTTHANTYGWMAVFHRGKEVFSTPADMASEANARALNLLLALSFEEQLKRLNRG